MKWKQGYCFRTADQRIEMEMTDSYGCQGNIKRGVLMVELFWIK